MSVETTRVGDGRSARFGALVVVGTLVAVAWVGFSNRPPAPPDVTPAPAIAIQPTSVPQPSVEPTPLAFATAPASSAHPPGERPVSTPGTAGSASATRDYYLVQVAFESRTFTNITNEASPGHFQAELSIPIPPPATSATLRLLVLLATAPAVPVEIAAWELPLQSLNAASGREYLVLDRRVAARRLLLNQPLPVLRGYRLTATAESGVVSGMIRVEMTMGPNGRILGDDGIFGWPTVAQIPSPATSQRPRERGAYNYCRWDVGVLAARPKFGQDESDCA